MLFRSPQNPKTPAESDCNFLMGLFELFLGYGAIPSMLIFLILLSLGVGRRQLNNVLLYWLNVHLNVNGNRVKLLPLLGIICFAYMINLIKKIQKYQEASLMHKDDVYAHPNRLEEIYLSYRNVFLNLCLIVLMF